MASGRLPLTIIVLTYNEAPNIAACLASVASWAGEIFVVDSGSTDSTLKIADRYGAQITHHPFETHTSQWAWALKTLPCSNNWILGLDADQRVTPELAAELRELLGSSVKHAVRAELTYSGFYIKRRQIFRGRWIKHGGYYPRYLLKLFRRDRVMMDPSDLVDHHFCVSGSAGRLRHDIIEENRKEDAISFWVDKHNRYAVLLGREEQARRLAARRGGLWESSSGYASNWQRRLWYRLPLFVRPFLYFFYRYFFQLGILDGREGMIFHFLQALWFRLLVDVNVQEWELCESNASAKEQVHVTPHTFPGQITS